MGEAFSAEATGVTKNNGGGTQMWQRGTGRGLGDGSRGAALGTARSLPDNPLHLEEAGVGRGEVGLRTRLRQPRARASARSCHPMSGECSCLPGWAGLHCNESCPQDTHGPGCQEHCLCLHGGVCQPDSGLCRCAPGYTVSRAPPRGRCGRGPGSPPAPLMSAPTHPPLSGTALR